MRVDPGAGPEHEPRRAVFSVTVEDEPGVLSRVVGLVACRQFSIESLTVGPTTVEDHPCIMTAIEGSESGVDQTGKQLAKLKPVIFVGELDDDAVRAELALLKVCGEDPDKVYIITKMYDGRIPDAGPETITVQLIDDEHKIDDAVDVFRQLGIIEVARTGQTVFAYGSKKTVPGEEPGTSGKFTKPNTNTQ